MQLSSDEFFDAHFSEPNVELTLSLGLAKRMSSLRGGLAHPDDYVEPTGEDD